MFDPVRFFAAASLVFGALMIALTPPFQTPDEPAHLFRAWSISEGTLFARGGARVPRSLVDAAAAGLARPAFTRTPLNPGDRVFVATVADSWRRPLGYTAPSYTPFGYAATAPAILVGRVLSLSPVALVYLGRLANLIASTLILALAIRRAPFGRWVLALLALTPMAVFMRASLSTDALTIACSVALVVEILRAQASSSIALSFVVAAIKPGYALVPLLALGVPRLRARRVVLALILVAMLAGTVVAYLWIREAGVPDDPSLGVDARARATALLHAPASYAVRLTREMAQVASLLAVQMVADFGWLNAPAPLTFALLWIAALIGLALADGPASGFSRAWSLAIFVPAIVAVTTVMHVGAPAGEFFIGLQGRYFIPYLPLALLPLCAFRTSEPAKSRVVLLLTGLAMLQSAWTLAERYWL
jgi:uncharacterized membrane protein